VSKFIANGVRYQPDAAEKHVESYFFKATAPDAERALWLKATIFGDHSGARAEAWAIAFDHRDGKRKHAAAKHILPIEQAHFGSQSLDIHWNAGDGDHIAIAGCELSGRVHTEEHDLSWDLRFEPRGKPFITLPTRRMYSGRFPSSKTVTPFPDARFFGSFTVDGETWEISDWRGMQGHNWGKGHAELYAWSHCNQWDCGEDTVIEAISARVPLGPWRPTFTVIYVRHRDVDYAFHGPRELLTSSGDIELRRYRFEARNGRARIRGEVEAASDEFAGLFYPNPDGPMTYCLNSKLATLRARLEIAGEEPLDLTSRAAALEIGTRASEHGVKMHV
jgi:hypothetical protein